MTTTIPCKRPKVTVTPRTPGDDRHDADCHVPGCAWTYPPDKQFMALKSDANDQATRHRREHRDAVPVCDVGAGLGGTHIISCVCGHQETRGTKTDALVHRDYHLSTAHGVVTCP